MDYSIFYLFILVLVSTFIHHFYKKNAHCQAAMGSIVMALGIITFDVLPQFQWMPHLIRQLMVMEILIIALYLVCFFVQRAIEIQFNIFTTNAVNQFGIGTWIAGSSILVILFLQQYPYWHIVIWSFSFCALFFWPIYLIISFRNLWHIFSKKIKLHTGNLLLLTVSTQAVALLTHALFANKLPILMTQAFIFLGYIFYIIGITILGKYLISHQKKRLILGWSNGYSIMHGALSISGLASITTHSMNNKVILSTWILATMVFFCIESLSLTKLYYRIKIKGLVLGMLIYNLSQWTRIFTFGMYYSFSLALFKQHLNTKFLLHHVVTYGKYVVLVLLLFEVFIFLQDKLSNRKTKIT